MLKGWRRVRLGDVLRRSTKRLGAAEAEPAILTCTEGHGLVDQLVHLGRRAASEDVATYKVVRPYDVVYNVYLLWLGAIGQNLTGELGITSPVYEVFTPIPEIEPRYLDLVLRSPSLIESYGTISIGTVPRRRRAPWQDFLLLEMDLPPLSEQRRIVDLISALDEAIQCSHEALELASAVLDAYRDSLHAPEVKTLGEIARMRSGPSWKATDESPTPGEGLSPVLAITNTTPAGVMDLSTIRYVRGLPDSAMRLTENSIVMIRTNGNRNRIGNVYRADDRVHGFSVSAFQIAIEPHSPEDAELIFQALAAPRFQRAASDAASGTTGLGNVAISWLKQVKIPWPEEGEARAFTETCAALGEQVEYQRQARSSLRILRSELLTALLSGEHQIPESYDEMNRELERTPA